MAHLSLSLLGPLQVLLDEEPVTAFESDKVRALLAYLAVEHERPQRRQHLAGLLWPDRPERSARQNLSQALFNLRHAIGDYDAEPPFLHISRATIQFNRSSDCWLDVTAFQDLLAACNEHPHDHLEDCDACLERLREAVGLYRGHFLAGFSAGDSPAFDEWTVLRRERLQRRMMDALNSLAASHEQRGEYEMALPYARRQVELAPWQEEAHQQIMRLLAYSGRRGAALAQYERCKQMLAEELGVEPAPATTALYKRIQATVFVESEEELLPPADVPCPYKGLAAYEPEDAQHFFGRENLVDELTGRLTHTHFLAVVGSSGSGKSSLVRAGLLPAIQRGALPGSEDWATLVLTPGEYPLKTLAARLSRLMEVAPGELLSEIEADPAGLDRVVRRRLADGPPPTRLLLVVDQFEEVFALCRDSEKRRRFIDALLHTGEAPHGRISVVLTIRTDFYGHCADYQPLAAGLQDRQVLIGPLGEDGLRAVIERPAEVAGLNLEPGLADTILDDVAGEPGALPLLSHALLETWRRRRGRTLTLAGYTESGGVAGAIAQTADRVYEQLSPEQQAIARHIFLRLTALGEDGAQDTRRRVTPEELIRRPEEEQAVRTVLQRLAEARLITVGEGTVEVAHEALIREWPTLRRWLEENREGLRVHRHLTQAAQGWAAMDRESGDLYRGARLASAREWAEAHGEELNPLEREFLEASQAAARRRAAAREARRQRELEAVRKVAEAERQRAEEQSRSSSRLRRLVAALATVFLLAVGAATFALDRQQMAQTAADELAAEVAVRSTAEAQAVAAEKTAVAERERAEQQARLALARELATQALIHRDERLDLALLLSLEANRLADTVETRGSLLTGLQSSPRLRTFLHGHTAGVSSVAFSPDGRFVASAGWDNTIRLWDVTRERPRGQPLTGHTDNVLAVAFSPDGEMLASAGRDEQVILWDVSTDKPIGQPLAGHSDLVLSVAFSPDGEVLASSGCGQRDANGRCVEGEIRLWDVSTGEPIGDALAAHADWVNTLAFSPDGETLASAGQDGTIRLWGTSSLLNVGSGESQPQGRLLKSGGTDVFSLAFSPDGRTLAVGEEDKTVMLWAVATGEPIGQPLAGHSDRVNSVAFSPDGEVLASGSSDKSIILWDTTTGEPVSQPLDGHSDHVGDVVFSPDGKTLVSGSGDGSVILWNVSNDQPLGQRLAGHSGWVYDVAFGPDGQTLASSGCGERAANDRCVQGEVHLWDAVTGQPIGQPVTALADAVESVTFRTGSYWQRQVQTGRSCCGTRRRAGLPAALSPAIPPSSTAWPSAPMVDGWRRAARIRRSSCGTWRRARPSGNRWPATPVRCWTSPSAPMGRR